MPEIPHRKTAHRTPYSSTPITVMLACATAGRGHARIDTMAAS